jgi:Protein phosphatase 2C
LCCDGLTDLVWNDEILEVVRSKSSLKEAVRALVDLANERGGHDNITVILISVPADFKPEAKKKNVDWLPWLLGGLAGIVVVATLAAFVTFRLLRLDVTFTPTPAVSATPLVTTTPLPTLTPTIIPTNTAAPDVITPTGPTLTPWPTNTVTP